MPPGGGADPWGLAMQFAKAQGDRYGNGRGQGDIIRQLVNMSKGAGGGAAAPPPPGGLPVQGGAAGPPPAVPGGGYNPARAALAYVMSQQGRARERGGRGGGYDRGR